MYEQTWTLQQLVHLGFPNFMDSLCKATTTALEGGDVVFLKHPFVTLVLQFPISEVWEQSSLAGLDDL